jgi:hypothetical protein
VEARQVAELLSQLPGEMDVEGLVAGAFSQAEAQAEATEELAPGRGGGAQGVARRCVHAAARLAGPARARSWCCRCACCVRGDQSLRKAG